MKVAHLNFYRRRGLGDGEVKNTLEKALSCRLIILNNIL